MDQPDPICNVAPVNIDNPQYALLPWTCTHEESAIRFACGDTPGAGRTLIELLIAIVLSLMIVAAVGSLYYFTSQSARTSQQSQQTSKSAGALPCSCSSEPIAMAGYGNINSCAQWVRRRGNTAMRGPPCGRASNGRFQNMPSVLLGFPVVDFTCVPSADPGDALFVRSRRSPRSARRRAADDRLPGLRPLR